MINMMFELPPPRSFHGWSFRLLRSGKIGLPGIQAWSSQLQLSIAFIEHFESFPLLEPERVPKNEFLIVIEIKGYRQIVRRCKLHPLTAARVENLVGTVERYREQALGTPFE